MTPYASNPSAIAIPPFAPRVDSTLACAEPMRGTRRAAMASAATEVASHRKLGAPQRHSPARKRGNSLVAGQEVRSTPSSCGRRDTLDPLRQGIRRA